MSDQESNDLESNSVKYLSLAFVSFIFIIIILAVGTQLFFSPEKVTNWVQEALEETGLKTKLQEAKVVVEFEKAQTTLTGSIFYPIGVRLSDVKIITDRGCKEYATNFKTVVVPFSIVGTLRGRFKLGTLKFSDGLTKEKNICFNEASKEIKSSQKSKSVTLAKKSLEKKLLDFNEDFVNVFNSLQGEQKTMGNVSGILVYDWTIKSGARSKDSMSFHLDRFKVYKGDTPVVIEGQFDGSLKFKDEALDFDGELFVSNEQITFSSKVKYKEGKVFINKSYRKGEETSLQVSADHMPLSVLFSLAGANKNFSNSFLRSTWLSTETKLSLKDKLIKGDVLTFDVETEDGSMEIVSGLSSGTWDSDSLKWRLDKPVKFVFANFKALNLLGAKEQKELRKVLSDFGKFDLSLTLDEQLNIKGAFESKGQSFSLRSGGRLGVQDIESSLGDFSWSYAKSFNLRLYQIKLEKGEFDGEFVYTKKNNKKTILADVKELSFNPDLWDEVFELDKVGSFSLKGETTIYEDKSTGEKEVNSDFVITLDYLNHKLWTIRDPRFDCVFAQFVSCNFKFSELKPKSNLSKWLNTQGRSVENIRTNGELSLENKALSLSLLYKDRRRGGLQMTWNVDQGPVVIFPDKTKLRFRNL